MRFATIKKHWILLTVLLVFLTLLTRIAIILLPLVGISATDWKIQKLKYCDSGSITFSTSLKCPLNISLNAASACLFCGSHKIATVDTGNLAVKKGETVGGTVQFLISGVKIPTDPSFDDVYIDLAANVTIRLFYLYLTFTIPYKFHIALDVAMDGTSEHRSITETISDYLNIEDTNGNLELIKSVKTTDLSDANTWESKFEVETSAMRLPSSIEEVDVTLEDIGVEIDMQADLKIQIERMSIKNTGMTLIVVVGADMKPSSIAGTLEGLVSGCSLTVRLGRTGKHRLDAASNSLATFQISTAGEPVGLPPSIIKMPHFSTVDRRVCISWCVTEAPVYVLIANAIYSLVKPYIPSIWIYEQERAMCRVDIIVPETKTRDLRKNSDLELVQISLVFVAECTVLETIYTLASSENGIRLKLHGSKAGWIDSIAMDIDRAGSPVIRYSGAVLSLAKNSTSVPVVVENTVLGTKLEMKETNRILHARLAVSIPKNVLEVPESVKIKVFETLSLVIRPENSMEEEFRIFVSFGDDRSDYRVIAGIGGTLTMAHGSYGVSLCIDGHPIETYCLTQEEMRMILKAILYGQYEDETVQCVQEPVRTAEKAKKTRFTKLFSSIKSKFKKYTPDKTSEKQAITEEEAVELVAAMGIEPINEKDIESQPGFATRLSKGESKDIAKCEILHIKPIAFENVNESKLLMRFQFFSEQLCRIFGNFLESLPLAKQPEFLDLDFAISDVPDLHLGVKEKKNSELNRFLAIRELQIGTRCRYRNTGARTVKLETEEEIAAKIEGIYGEKDEAKRYIEVLGHRSIGDEILKCPIELKLVLDISEITNYVKNADATTIEICGDTGRVSTIASIMNFIGSIPVATQEPSPQAVDYCITKQHSVFLLLRSSSLLNFIGDPVSLLIATSDRHYAQSTMAGLMYDRDVCPVGYPVRFPLVFFLGTDSPQPCPVEHMKLFSEKVASKTKEMYISVIFGNKAHDIVATVRGESIARDTAKLIDGKIVKKALGVVRGAIKDVDKNKSTLNVFLLKTLGYFKKINPMKVACEDDSKVKKAMIAGLSQHRAG